jgi:molybdenum cofactor synthesis domain-containing protein
MELERIAAVLVASDSRADGRRVDETGPAAEAALAALGIGIVEVAVVPDERARLAQKLAELADRDGVHLVLTAGGTGLSPRDVTPEATREVIERDAPGLAELLRARSLAVTPHAALSRGIAGVRGRALIINLPGSPKAVRESIDFLADALPHALEVVAGRAVECGRRDPGDDG